MHQLLISFDRIARMLKIAVLSWVILLPAAGWAGTHYGVRLKAELFRCSASMSQRSPGLLLMDRSVSAYLQGTDSSATQGFSNPGFAGRAFNDLWYGVKTGFSDLGYIYSSPARINTNSALWVGGILALGGVIFAYDQEIYNAFKRNQDHALYKPIREVGEFFEPLGYMGFTNKYYFSALVLGYLTGYRPLLYFSVDILEAYFIAGLFKNGANVLVGRRRPAYGEGPYSFKFADGTSFPSGHALNVVQLARTLSHHIRFLPVQVAAYGIAATVCLERITSDAHWPSDVYVGAVFGWAVAAEVLRLNDKRRIEIIPITFEDTVGVKFILKI
jgi:membrane-associated phospholipid phosphatase